MDGWTNIFGDIVARSSRTGPPMSLGVSPRFTFIRPSLDKNGSPALVYFRYYPPQNHYQYACLFLLLLEVCGMLSEILRVQACTGHTTMTIFYKSLFYKSSKENKVSNVIIFRRVFLSLCLVDSSYFIFVDS